MATISTLPSRQIKSTDYFIIETEGEATARTQWNLEALGLVAKAAFDELKTKVDGLKDEIKGEIEGEIASAYTAKGSVEFGSLPDLTSASVGWVYNVTDEFDTDENFVEGEGKHYPANTNVVVTDYEGSGTKKWDVLGGFLDLSGYALKTELQSATSDITQLQSDVKTAQTAAETAQAAADLAKQNAATAQSAAEEASTAASQAQSKAETAETAANGAQSALDSFKSEVKKNYIEITTASEAV